VLNTQVEGQSWNTKGFQLKNEAHERLNTSEVEVGKSGACVLAQCGSSSPGSNV